MMSFYLSGGVEVLGFISPTEPTDEYPVIDPLYGIDGFRNVNTLSDLNSIPNLRRRAGMVVGVSGGAQYYKLNPSPWNGSITDWSIFNSGSGGGETFTGGTVTGDTIFTQGVTATTFSAATYLGLPLDVYVTGGTYSNGILTFTNNSGGTFNVIGLNTGTTINLSGGTGISVSGTSPNFIVENTLPDQIVNLSGGTNINVTGTYPNFGIEFTGVASSSFTGGTVTGDTIFTQGVTATTISATTYQNLPLDVYVTGGTYSNGAIVFTNNSGSTFNVTGLYTGQTSYVNSLTTGVGLSADTTTGNITIINTDPDQTVTLSGGTGILTGGTYPNFTIENSLPDQTVVLNNGSNISVTGTYPNFTIDVTGLTDNDIYVTGFTYDNNNTFTISQNSGTPLTATINVVSGLTVNGDLIITGNTTLNTLSATTIGISGDCVNDIYVSNIHSCSPLNINPLDEGNVYFGSTSGVTIDLTNTRIGIGTISPQAKLHVSGDTLISGNTSTDMLRITQTGTGNAFVVEDSTNPDTTPFIINSAGTTNIGSTNVYTDSTNLAAKLQVSNGVFGGSLSGLASSTTAIIQANTTNSLGLLSPNANTSTLYLGTPSDVYGSIMQWQYTNKRLYFGTQSSNSQIRFTTGAGTERVIFDENGNVGIGTLSPTEKLQVSGNALISGNLTATTISATTYQNLPTDIRVTGATYSNNNFTFTNNTGGTFNVSFNSVTGLTVNGNLTVTGNTNVRAVTGTTALFSGSGQNILTVIGSGNTTSSPLFTVQGSSGELFSVTDSLVGSLYSVNDISGLPILEVFSDNTILMGSYQAPSLNTTTKVTATTGTTNVYSIPTSAYTGAFFDYIVSDGTNLRAGNIMSIWSGSSVNYTETQTTDFGNTSGLTFNMVVSSGNAILRTSGVTGNWTVKTIVRSI
jgi:hypothetical protein